jgi:mannose-6-phosphate isomerase
MNDAVISSAPLSHFDFPVSRVEKPWGYELIYAVTDRYCGKLLFVRAGEMLSLQLHERKDETIFLHSGRAIVEIAGDGQPLRSEVVEPGRAFRIEPTTIHRLRALDDSLFLEVSTPDLDDVVRLEDRYGRDSSDGADGAVPTS